LWVANAVVPMISSARCLGAPCAVLAARTLPANDAHRGGDVAVPGQAGFAGYLIRREPQAADAMPWFTAPGGAG